MWTGQPSCQLVHLRSGRRYRRRDRLNAMTAITTSNSTKIKRAGTTLCWTWTWAESKQAGQFDFTLAPVRDHRPGGVLASGR
jgi:hypothetical protein